MNEKLAAVWAKVKALLAAAYAFSPFFAGLAVGYFGKPAIQFAVNLAAKLVKFIAG